MASKKTRQEEKAKKKTKPENRNRKKTSSKKPNNHTNNKKTSNGAVKEPEVVATPSSSADSQQEPESLEESEQEQEKRSEEASNQRNKSKKPKKNSQKREEGDEEEEENEKVCRFPTRRIWRIVKSQSSGSSITGEAVFLVNKATEKFLEQFCEDAYAQCVKDRKKSLSYQHLASVVSRQRRYDFLSDFVPEKIKAEAALAESKLIEKGAGSEGL